MFFLFNVFAFYLQTVTLSCALVIMSSGTQSKLLLESSSVWKIKCFISSFVSEEEFSQCLSLAASMMASW